MFVKVSEVIDADWLRLDPLRVRRIPATLGTPDRYVTVTDDGRRVLRVDVYAHGAECFASENAILWRHNLVIGFGSHVHAVCIATRAAVSVSLESYYGGFYPTSDYLLIASGERLFRMEPDRSILWRSAVIACDGLVVDDAGPPVVRGKAEWDPPGGWRPFAVFVADGKAAA